MWTEWANGRTDLAVIDYHLKHKRFTRQTMGWCGYKTETLFLLHFSLWDMHAVRIMSRGSGAKALHEKVALVRSVSFLNPRRRKFFNLWFLLNRRRRHVIVLGGYIHFCHVRCWCGQSRGGQGKFSVHQTPTRKEKARTIRIRIAITRR